MIPDTAQLLAAPPWLLDLLDTSTRVTVLLAAAALTVALLRRAPAQARHQVWTLALAGALLLPLVALVLPAWHLRILPASTAPAIILPPRALETSARAYAFDLDEARGHRSQARPASLVELPPPPPARLPLAARVLNDVLRPLAPSPRVPALPLSLDLWLLAVWLSGIAVVLGRVAFDRVQVWYLAQRSRPVQDGERASRFDVLQRQLGLRGVALVELADVELPMTWGVLRPTVALPASSRRWTGARLDAVLLHELAHVRRRDAFTQLVASVACAFYWFHPLTWFAARQMRVLREYACDDEVLGQGVRPSSYAEELIGIVQALRREERESSATLAMARRSALGARLLALLDPGIPHARLARGPAAALSAGALAVLVSAAVVRPAAADTPAALPRLAPAQAAQRQAQLPLVASPADVAPPAGSTPANGATAVGAPAAEPAPVAAPAPRARRSSRAPEAVPAALAAPAGPAAPAAVNAPAAPPAVNAPAAPAAPRGADSAWDQDADWDPVDGEGSFELDVAAPDVHLQFGRTRPRSDDEELGRLEAMRKSAGGDERALTRSLRKLAHDADFETETSRQAYLAATASLSDDGLRLEALQALLKGAPISVETGRGILAQAHRFRDDPQALALLSMMHHIRESDLVRGPLTGAYLDVAGQLQSQESLARALRELLHPQQVSTDGVLKALALLQRVSDSSLRKAVLVEVTDHQQITPAVEAAYTGLLQGLEGRALEDAQERLTESKGQRHRNRGNRWAFFWNGDRGDDASRAANDAVRRADLERMRAELEQELASERESLRKSQAQLQESARDLQQKARALTRKYQERARALQEKLRQQFGSGDQPDADPDGK